MYCMKNIGKRVFAVLLSSLLCLSVFEAVRAKDEARVAESFETVESWLATDADKISLNTDKAYVKDGDGSLCLLYPAARRGNDLYITNTAWNSGGFRLPPADDGLVVSKIGMWVYGCGDSNIQMKISTKVSGETSNVISEPCLLDFWGWKYLSFDVNNKTEALIYINVQRVSNKIENLQDKHIYIDALSVEYDYDPSQKAELDVSSSIVSGAVRIPIDAAPVFTFTNIIDENNMFDIHVSPQTEFSLEKISGKQYRMLFGRPLEPATQYHIKLIGVIDIFGQTLDKEFSFTTADFSLEVLKLFSNGAEIERITEAEAGEVSLQISLQSYIEVNPDNEALVMCSVFDANGYMTGFACQRVRLSQLKQTVTLTMNTSQKAIRGEVFVLDSMSNRRIVEHVSLGGE